MIRAKNVLTEEAKAGLVIVSTIKGLSICPDTVNSVNFDTKVEKFTKGEDILLSLPFYISSDSKLVAKFDGRRNYMLPSVAGYIIFSKDAAKKMIGFKRFRNEVSKTRHAQVLTVAQHVIETLNQAIAEEML